MNGQRGFLRQMEQQRTQMIHWGIECLKKDL